VCFLVKSDDICNDTKPLWYLSTVVSSHTIVCCGNGKLSGFISNWNETFEVLSVNHQRVIAVWLAFVNVQSEYSA